jgi:hypothetical protein
MNLIYLNYTFLWSRLLGLLLSNNLGRVVLLTSISVSADLIASIFRVEAYVFSRTLSEL